MDKNQNEEIREMSEYAKLNNVPIMLDDGLEFLLQSIRENNVHSFLEIGTAIAKTSILVAGMDEDMKVVTIERNPQMIEQAKINIENSGLKNKILLIQGDALETEISGGPFDCVFIDAAKAQYRRFFLKYAPLLAPDGIIVSDNLNFHGLVDHPENTHNRNTKDLVRKIKAYREFLSGLEDYETIFTDRGDGVAITRRK